MMNVVGSLATGADFVAVGLITTVFIGVGVRCVPMSVNAP